MDQRDRESILEDLGSADDEVRRLAVERAALLAPLEAVPLLIERLGDESWRVRKAAIDRLAATPEPARAAASLLRALADGDNPGRRNAALEALIRCGSSVVPTLLDASASADVDVRKQVVDALSGIADPGALPRLVELLEDADANVRAAAADALGAIGGGGCSVPLLERVTADPERLVRLSALRALARLEHPVSVASLESCLADAALQAPALALLGHSDDAAALEAILKGLAGDARSAREAAMGAALRLLSRATPGEAERIATRAREVALADPSLVDAALARLEVGDLASRLTLVQFLGMLHDGRAVVPLLHAGLDEALEEVVVGALWDHGEAAEVALAAAWPGLAPDARALACEVLGAGRSAVGERLLVGTLAEPDAEVRGAAVRALARRGGPAALESLVLRFARAASETEGDVDEVDLLADAIAAAVRAAPAGDAQALAARAVELVAERLHDADEGFRRGAARLLGSIGSADSICLDLLMSDPSEAVRRAAVEAVARLGGDVLPESLRLALADESPSVRIAAAGALASAADPNALEDLERLGLDEDPRVRAAAMRAAGAMQGAGEEDASRRLGLLERGVADEGPVAIAALEALRRLRDPRAVGVAARLLEADAPELVCAAIACVGSAAELPRLEMLVPLVEHESWTVRVEAIRVLGERRLRKAAPAVLRRLEGERDEFVRQAILQALERLES